MFLESKLKTMVSSHPIIEHLDVHAPWGILSVAMQNETILGVDLSPNRADNPPTFVPSTQASRFSQLVQLQFKAYFSDPLQVFDLPLRVSGTQFQLRVWQLLSEIKSGCVLTYGEAANQLDTGARAIGNACRANPTPIIVPCHRILAKNSLGGFAGKTTGMNIDIKQRLLEHEGIHR